MNTEFDLLVVGGGVLGTFHAYHALQKGLKVALFEKSNRPQGASVRNFGQVVPSGMDSKWQAYGRESLKIYKEIQAEFDISVRPYGSVYIASNEEEEQLLEELYLINQQNGYTSNRCSQQECLETYPGLRKDYARSGLFFPEEITVEPLTLVSRLQEYLVSKGLSLHLGTTVTECLPGTGGASLRTADGRSFWGAKAVICSGSDFNLLYPHLFLESDMEVCKLQMMATAPQPNYTLPGSILTGWSIRRYEAFHECPSYAAIKAREEATSTQKEYGVHILFKQAMDGSIILGDSHHYAAPDQTEDLDFRLDMEVDHFIEEAAKQIIQLPNYTIKHRWYGQYCQCKTTDIFRHTLENQIHIVTGIGGKGMTGSAGYSKESINQIFEQ